MRGHLNIKTMRLYDALWAGIVTGQGPDGSGIESRCRRDFPHPPISSLGPPGLVYNGYRVFLQGIKRQGRGADHPSSSLAEAK